MVVLCSNSVRPYPEVTGYEHWLILDQPYNPLQEILVLWLDTDKRQPLFPKDQGRGKSTGSLVPCPRGSAGISYFPCDLHVPCLEGGKY